MMIWAQNGSIIYIVSSTFAPWRNVMHLYGNTKTTNHAFVLKCFECSIAKISMAVVNHSVFVVALARAVFVFVYCMRMSIERFAAMGAWFGDSFPAFVVACALCLWMVVFVGARFGTEYFISDLRRPSCYFLAASSAFDCYFPAAFILSFPDGVTLFGTKLRRLFSVWALASTERLIANNAICVCVIHCVLQIKSALAFVRSCCLGNAERQSAKIRLSDFQQTNNYRRLHCLDNNIIAQAF